MILPPPVTVTIAPPALQMAMPSQTISPVPAQVGVGEAAGAIDRPLSPVAKAILWTLGLGTAGVIAYNLLGRPAYEPVPATLRSGRRPNPTKRASFPVGNLILALAAANDVAQAAARAQSFDDGGSSNFDAPVIVVPKRDAKRYEEIIEDEGYSSYRWGKRADSVALVLGLHIPGQGFMRTKGAEAAEQELRRRGYVTKMYYQAD